MRACARAHAHAQARRGCDPHTGGQLQLAAAWCARARAAAAKSTEASGAARTTTGEAKVIDLMPDDVDDEFEVRVSVKAASGAADHDAKARDGMKGPAAKEVRRAMRAFAAELVEHDGGQEKLALDAVSQPSRRRRCRHRVPDRRWWWRRTS